MINRRPETTTVLENVIPTEAEYPEVLEKTTRLLIKEQPNLIPIYMDGSIVNCLESGVIQAEAFGPVHKKLEQIKAGQFIDNYRGDIRNLVDGMERYGSRSFPKLMVMTDDLSTPDPAIRKAKHPRFDFEIQPKQFRMGLTGRLLEDKDGQRFDEALHIGLNIYNAYDFARSISPEMIVAVTEDDEGYIVYKENRPLGRMTERKPAEKTLYVLNEDEKEHWHCDTTVLPTGGLRIVTPEFNKRIKRYIEDSFAPIQFGHNFADIDEFFERVMIIDDHLIWKICKNDRGPNTPLADAGPEYCRRNGEPWPHHVNRLHLMADKASLYFRDTSIHFDRSVALKALMELDDIVTDIWFGPIDREWDDGWDIVYDKSRGITPDSPVAVHNEADYRKHAVAKKPMPILSIQSPISEPQ
jgi:hypothetical protein